MFRGPVGPRSETPLQREKDYLNHILAMDTRARIVKETDTPLGFIAASQSTVRTLERARDLATVSSPVLITGPPGSGKRALAMAQHGWSGSKQEVCPLDCHSLRPEDISRHRSSNQTLIFNELGELPPATQSELLTQIITPSTDRTGQLRLVATSTHSLTQLVESSLLLDVIADHFSTIQLTLDPLFLRPDDVMALTLHFLKQAYSQYQKKVVLPDATLRLLPQLHYPVNVSSLKELITHTVIDASDEAVIPTLAVETLLSRATPPTSLAAPWFGITLKADLILHERRLIRQALIHEKGKLTRAARILGLSHQTLANRLRSHHPDVAQLYLHSRRRR